MTVLLRRGDDAAMHVPVERIDAGWSVRAELREYPTGPVKESWSSGDGSAVIERGEVVLLMDRLTGDWSSAEVTVTLLDPQGVRTVLPPERVRLR